MKGCLWIFNIIFKLRLRLKFKLKLKKRSRKGESSYILLQCLKNKHGIIVDNSYYPDDTMLILYMQH